MSFLNSTLLAWLVPLLLLPILIHALHKKFPTLFPFSSVQHLQMTISRRSRLFRWRHLILLLLRTCALGLLLLVFLKPVLPLLGSDPGSKGARHVLIIIDHSLSMEYKGQSLSPRKRAAIEAEKILETLGSDDQVNVLLAGLTTVACFVDFSNNHAEARRCVDTLAPGFTRADYHQINTDAAQQLAKLKQPGEVYYISDFQRKNWANVDFSNFPPKTRLFFVDAGVRGAENQAILGATLTPLRPLSGETVLMEVEVGNYAPRPMNQRLQVLIDNQASFEKEVAVPPWSTAKVILPLTLGKPGLHLCEISLPDDDLPQDNHFYLTIEVLEREEVLVVSDEEDTLKSGVYFLQTALNPYEGARGALLPRRIRSEELSPVALAGVKKLFLSRINPLSQASCSVLAKYLFQGGGMAYFLDGKSDSENLRQLEKVIGAKTMPISLGEKRISGNISAASQQISRGDFKSRYLKLFRGMGRQNLALMEFYDSYRAASTGSGEVLLSYGDDSPAMAELDYGMGSLLLMNFSVSEYSSNLARQRVFPAWIQEIVKNLGSSQEISPTYIVGEAVTAEMWKVDAQTYPLKSPKGSSAQLKREVLGGDRSAVSFIPDKSGFYTLGAVEPRYAFGVNTSPEESDLRSIDKNVLPETLGSSQQAHFVQGERDYAEIVTGRPIFQYFIIAALIMLLAEMGFQWIIKLNG